MVSAIFSASEMGAKAMEIGGAEGKGYCKAFKFCEKLKLHLMGETGRDLRRPSFVACGVLSFGLQW